MRGVDVRRLLFATATALLYLVAAAPAIAQTGGMRVTVLDAESRESLPGATIVLSNAQGYLAPTAAMSDARGQAVFPVLRAGAGYAVQVSLPGYATHKVLDLRVESSRTGEIVLVLTPRLEERVEVIERSSVVDVDRAAHTSRFSDQFLENLPVPGRFYQETLTFAPGVNDADGDGNPNVHGARSRDFKATVSGVSNVDPLTGQWLSYVNPDSIEVMEVVPSGAGVEFGRAQGGFARIVQKQGTNEFQGVFNLLYRTSDLDGTGAVSGIPDELVPEFTWVQPAVQLSGPLIKDKLWFRLSHEWIKREDPVDTIGTLVPTTTEQRLIADQITWQVSPRNKLAFQYQYDPLTLEGNGISSTLPLESTSTLERGGPTYSVTWTAPQSPRLLAETVVAYQDHYQNSFPTDPDARQDCVTFWSATFPVLNEAYCRRSLLGNTSGAFPETSEDKRQRLTLHGKVTWYVGRALGANHRVQAGLIFENERYQRDLARGPEIVDIDPFVVLTPADSPFCSLCPVAKGLITVRVPVPEETSGSATGNNWAVYVEDQIKPLDSLAITVGLRLDREELSADGRLPFDPAAEAAAFQALMARGVQVGSGLRQSFTSFPDIPGFQQSLAEVLASRPDRLPLSPGAIQSTFWANKQRLGDIHITNTNFSPRLSVAWDPWRRGKSKFALSAGRYYDKIFLAVPLIEVEPQTTDLVFDANGTFPERAGVFGDHFFARALLPSLGSTVSTQLVDRNLSTPFQDEFTLSAEYEVWRETSVRLSYIRRDFEDQLQDVDINHVQRDLGACVVGPVLGDPVVRASEGSGFVLTDVWTGEQYEDTDPGPGDGILDDCTGAIRTVHTGHFGVELRREPLPDGLVDLYVQNPGWGDVLLLGNDNSASYRGLVLELNRRFYRNWELQGSYTWSRVTGDGEDYLQQNGNERNLLEQEYGFLSHDQRHVVQVTAMSITPWWGIRLGGMVRWESGVPFSILEPTLTVTGSPLEYLNLGRSASARFRLRYPTEQRNDQRNPSFWTFDARIAKEVRIGRVGVQLTLEAFNLANDGSLQIESRTLGVNTGTRRFGRRYQLGLRVGF